MGRKSKVGPKRAQHCTFHDDLLHEGHRHTQDCTRGQAAIRARLQTKSGWLGPCKWSLVGSAFQRHSINLSVYEQNKQLQ